MNNATSFSAVVFPNSSPSILARLVGAQAALITQASLTSITRKTFLVNTGGEAGGDTLIETSHPIIANVIFDMIQTDPAWTVDSIGYNFLDTLAPGIVTNPGRYQVQYSFVPVAGNPFPLIVDLVAREEAKV